MTQPYWGKLDANIDWCEKNYEWTWYIAELFNTMSSLVIFLLGIYGLLKLHKSFDEARFRWCFFFLAVTGFGSCLFHMTMRRWAQVLDELPMLWGNIAWLYVVVEHSPKPRYPGLPMILSMFGSVLTLIYLFFPNLFLVFFISYASILGATTIGMLIRTCDGEVHPAALTGFISSIFIFFVGFCGWIYENQYCDTLPGWLQLHAIWHIAAGTGVYLGITVSVLARAGVYNRNKDARVIIPACAACCLKGEHYRHSTEDDHDNAWYLLPWVHIEKGKPG